MSGVLLGRIALPAGIVIEFYREQDLFMTDLPEQWTGIVLGESMATCFHERPVGRHETLHHRLDPVVSRPVSRDSVTMTAVYRTSSGHQPDEPWRFPGLTAGAGLCSARR